MQIQEDNYIIKYSLKLAQRMFNWLQLHMKNTTTNNSHKSHVVILIWKENCGK
jgi:hypothetical protein